MRVKVLRKHTYGGRARLQGDEYSIDNPKHVKLFEAMKKIRRVAVTPAPVVVVPVVAPVSAVEPEQKRAYARKDMAASDTPKRAYNRKTIWPADGKTFKG